MRAVRWKWVVDGIVVSWYVSTHVPGVSTHTVGLPEWWVSGVCVVVYPVLFIGLCGLLYRAGAVFVVGRLRPGTSLTSVGVTRVAV